MSDAAHVVVLSPADLEALVERAVDRVLSRAQLLKVASPSVDGNDTPELTMAAACRRHRVGRERIRRLVANGALRPVRTQVMPGGQEGYVFLADDVARALASA